MSMYSVHRIYIYTYNAPVRVMRGFCTSVLYKQASMPVVREQVAIACVNSTISLFRH